MRYARTSSAERAAQSSRREAMNPTRYREACAVFTTLETPQEAWQSLQGRGILNQFFKLGYKSLDVVCYVERFVQMRSGLAIHLHDRKVSTRQQSAVHGRQTPRVDRSWHTTLTHACAD